MGALRAGSFVSFITPDLLSHPGDRYSSCPLAQIRKYIQRGEVTCPRSHSCKGTEPEFEWVPQSWEQTEGYKPRLNEWRLPLQDTSAGA